MRRLLIVTPCIPNGLPTQGAVMARHLREDGTDVTVVSRARTSLGRVLDVFTRGSWQILRHRVVLVDVFAERAFVYESFAILLASLLRRRVVAMLHSGLLPDFARRWPRWAPFVLSKADVVLTPHEYLRDSLSGVRIRIDGAIPNFIDLRHYVFRRRNVLAPRLLYLRGTDPLYNPQMALRALALIQEQYPDASMTIAGRDGGDLGRCRELVGELNLRNVSFTGLVPKQDIPVLADQHDIHLHTNRVDNMPVTILEMWACGLPVVATAVGGVPYLVQDGVNALLVPSEDHRAMADACLALLRQSGLGARLSVQGRARVEQLTWARVRPLWERALFEDWSQLDVQSAKGSIPLAPDRNETAAQS
jgi:glycosyltransferase involved in cell wall biosynthesis